MMFHSKLGHSLLYGGLLLLSTHAVAQVRPKNLRISVVNEAVAIPIISSPKLTLHPGLHVGTDLRVRSGKHWQRSLGADAYYYYHRLSEHAIMLDAAYRIGYRFKFGLQPFLLTALGYKHSFLAGDKYKHENGIYQKTRHAGVPQANFKLGYGLEYALSEKFSLSLQQIALISAPAGNIYVPFSPHTFLSIGMKINFLQK